MGGGKKKKNTYSTAYLQPRKVVTDTSQMTAKYSLSFIPPGFLMPQSLSTTCDSMTFLSFTLSVKRSHSLFYYANVVDGVASLVELSD